MKMTQYRKEREELSLFIQHLVEDNTIVVNKILHGNHDSQVHIYLQKRANPYTTTGDATLFVEIKHGVSEGQNIYSSKIIQDIKKHLSKKVILDAFPEWFK